MLALSCQSSLSVRRCGMVLCACAAVPVRTTAPAKRIRRLKKRAASMILSPIEAFGGGGGVTRTSAAWIDSARGAVLRAAQRHAIPLYHAHHAAREHGCPHALRR